MIAATPEKKVTLLASEVERREKQDVSIIPQALEQTKSEAELADRIAHLLTHTSPPGGRTKTITMGASP